jgi:predicted kinase
MPAHMPPDQIEQLAAEFYNKLDKPSAMKAKPQFCICPIGLVGSGKTTVLKKIVEQLPAIRVSADEVREMLGTKGLPFDDAMYIADALCTRLKQEGYNLAHDGDFASPASRQLHAQANSTVPGIRELWIRIQAPDDVVLKNIRARGPGKLFQSTDQLVELYERRKALHAAPELNEIPYLYIFDTSRPDLDDQVNEFVRRAKEQLQ